MFVERIRPKNVVGDADANRFRKLPLGNAGPRHDGKSALSQLLDTKGLLTRGKIRQDDSGLALFATFRFRRIGNRKKIYERVFVFSISLVTYDRVKVPEGVPQKFQGLAWITPVSGELFCCPAPSCMSGVFSVTKETDNILLAGDKRSVGI